jgi:hypothetical protein
MPQKKCGQMRCPASTVISAASMTGVSATPSGRAIARLYTSAAEASPGCAVLRKQSGASFASVCASFCVVGRGMGGVLRDAW